MWTLEKINQYINNGVEENLHLDYKGAGSISKDDKKKRELSKDISAFANSDGGTIIYGVKEYDEKDKRHLPERIDAIDGNTFTKEWIEQIINATISPRISGIVITPIQCEEKEKNKIIIIIDVPKSNTAHQSQDKRYYKRYNFESIMMDDYEIKDIINRSSKSDIQIMFRVQDMPKRTVENDIRDGRKYFIKLDVWAYNNGNKVAQMLNCFLSGKSEVSNLILKPRTPRDNKFELLFSNEVERKITINDDGFVVNVDRIPILPKTSRLIGELNISTSFMIKNLAINLQVATEDNSYQKIIVGNEMLALYHM